MRKNFIHFDKFHSRFFAILLIILLVIFPTSDTNCENSSQLAEILNKAHVEKREEFIVVYLTGSHFEMGYQQGVLLKNEIRNLWKEYFINTCLKGVSNNFIIQFIILNYFKLKSLRYQKYIPHELKEEILGISKGSGLSYTNILTMNTFLDTEGYIRKKSKGCTNFVLMPKITEGNTLYHARNLGFSPQKFLDKNRIIFFCEPENRIPFISIGWPGMCGVLSGMNMEGISISETSVGTAEVNDNGLPVMLLLRKVIECADTIDFAIKEIISNPKICGYTVTISEDDKQAVVIEFTGKRYTIMYPQDNYLISVNHYLSTNLLETMRPVYPHVILEETSSYKRLKKFETFIKSNKTFSLHDIEILLRTPPLSSDYLLQSIVFNPENKKCFIYSELQKQWLEFSLTDIFTDYVPKGSETINLISNEKIYPVLESKSENRHYTEFVFTYEPPIKNRLPDRKIWIYLFVPKGVRDYPLFLCLPHLAGVSQQIEGNLAKFLTKNGFAFLTFETGYQKNYKNYKELRKEKTKYELSLIYLDLMKEFVSESQNILSWAMEHESIDKDKICIGGISFGSIVSELILELRDDIQCGVFLLGSADLETLFLKSKMFKNITVEIMKNSETSKEIFDTIKFFDPITYAYKLNNKNIMMVNAYFDRYIPRECTLKLWRAAGCPEITWLIAGHVTSFFYLGFVERKMLTFLMESVKEQHPFQSGTSLRPPQTIDGIYTGSLCESGKKRSSFRVPVYD